MTTLDRTRDLAEQYRDLWQRTAPTDWRPHGRKAGAARAKRQGGNRRNRRRGRQRARQQTRENFR